MKTVPDEPERLRQEKDSEEWKNAEENLRELKAKAAESPHDAKTRVRVAEALYILSNIDEAIAEAEIAIREAENADGLKDCLAGAHYIKGAALVAGGRNAEALPPLERAIDLDPDHWNAWREKGNALIKLRQNAEAIECFEEGLRLNPDNPGLYAGKGYALFLSNKFEEAIKALDQCIGREPNHIYAHRIRGTALFQLGRADEALAEEDHAVDINPKDPLAHFERWRMLEHFGRSEEADRALQVAMELDPSRYLLRQAADISRLKKRMGVM